MGCFHILAIVNKPAVNGGVYICMLRHFSSVQFCHSVMSDSLRPHERQHTRPPCLSPTPGGYPNSWPLSQCCHLSISSSVIPFSSRLQSFPTSGFFIWVSSSHQVAKILEFQLQHQSLQWTPRTDFFYELDGSPCSPRDSQESSPTPQFKSISSSALSILHSPTQNPYMTTGKTIALTRWTFPDKVMSLLFNMLSRLVKTFLPRSKRLLISWLQSPSAVILEPPKIKSDTVSTVFPSISHEVMGRDATILVFWMLSFKPTFSLSYFTFIKRLFISSSFSAIRVVSFAYLRLLIFFPAILIPAFASSSISHDVLCV